MALQLAIDDLDRRISASEDKDELVHLKRQRNALLPVCSLPAELFVKVVTMLQHDQGARIDISTIHSRPLNRTWCWGMNACAYFRDLIRNTPTLWNTIDFRYRNPTGWIKMCLRLSQDTPLCIRDTTGRSKSVFSRAHLAQLDGDAVTGDMLNEPAPNLKELVISYANEPFSVTCFFLGGTSIALTSLYLFGDKISLEGSPEMPFLRCLILRLTHMKPELSLEPLFQLVAHAPRLEIVHIDRLCLLWTEDEIEESKIIEVPGRAVLPNLRTLIIAGEAVVVSALLRLFPTPAKHLDIRAHEEALAQHQVLIHESYLSFIRQFPNHADQENGRIILADEYEYRIEFGEPHELHATQYSDLDTSASCVISFDPEILPSRTIFAAADAVTCFYDDQYLKEAAESVFNLRTLILRDWEEDALTDDVKAWFLSRLGCIERMELIRCPEVVRIFAEQLLREGKVTQLVCTY
jgi:hypothetical protein